MQRRDLFRHAARLAALLAWQRLFAATAVSPPPTSWQAPGTNVFALGVASGEPLPTSVVIWTRLAPQPLQADGGMPPHAVAVQWEVAHDLRFARTVQRGEARAVPGAAHSVHVEVPGLQPGREYFYRFTAGGQTSPVGRTRTAPDPADRPGRLRLALASCQHFEAGAYAVHREIARTDVDAVVFVGDYIYETSLHQMWRQRRHLVDFDTGLTLDNYRRHYGQYKQDADLKACHAAHPWLLTWDDHEVFNDYDGDHVLDMLPEQFLQVRAQAYQAYFEHQPVSPRRAPVGPDAAMHTHYTWGRLADIWLLDTRQYRSPPPCVGTVHSPYANRLLWRCDDARAPGRSMLGPAQEQWLAAGLAASRGAWRLIAQSTQITPGAFRIPGDPLLYSDGWDAFPAARERLMAAIAQPRVPDVVCLSGDVHRHVAANLRLHPTDPSSPIIASELATSSITSRGLSEALTDWMRASNPDLLHVRSDERGFSLLDIDERRLQCDFMATAHPVRPDATLRVQARYVVERGIAGPRKA